MSYNIACSTSLYPCNYSHVTLNTNPSWTSCLFWINVNQVDCKREVKDDKRAIQTPEEKNDKAIVMKKITKDIKMFTRH